MKAKTLARSDEFIHLVRVALDIFEHKRPLCEAISRSRGHVFEERATRVRDSLAQTIARTPDSEADQISFERFYDVFYCNPAEFEGYVVRIRDAARRLHEAFPELEQLSDNQRDSLFRKAIIGRSVETQEVGSDNPVLKLIAETLDLDPEQVADFWSRGVSSDGSTASVNAEGEKACALSFSEEIVLAMATYTSAVVGCVASAAFPPAFFGCAALATASFFLIVFGAQASFDRCVAERKAAQDKP
jgi:hypothetical protein